VGHDFFAEGVEGADNRDAVNRGGAHGEVRGVAFALAVVFFVAFDVDDVGDVGGHEAFGAFGVFVILEVFVESWVCGITLGDFLAFELLEQSALEKPFPEGVFAELGHVFVIDTFDQRMLIEDQLDLFFGDCESHGTIHCYWLYARENVVSTSSLISFNSMCTQ